MESLSGATSPALIYKGMLYLHARNSLKSLQVSAYRQFVIHRLLVLLHESIKAVPSAASENSYRCLDEIVCILVPHRIEEMQKENPFRVIK